MKAVYALLLLVAMFGASGAQAANECKSTQDIVEQIQIEVPSAAFAVLDDKQYAIIKAQVEADRGPQDIDQIMVGHADGKATVLITEFKGGCFVAATFMENSVFFNLMSGV